MRKVIAFQMLAVLVILSSCSIFVPMERPTGTARSLLFWMPGVASVQVLSDWNEWGGHVAAGGIINPVEGRMEKLDNGFWSYEVSGLDPGVYRYAFLICGYKWMNDPANPETADFQGRTVSVMLVRD